MTYSLLSTAIFLGLMIFTYFSWRKIEYGIYAVIFLLPIYLLRFAFFSIPTTALEIGIYILFLIWLIKNYRDINWREIIPDKTLKNGIILLMAGVIVSTFLSSDLKTSAGILKGWFFDPFLFFIILVSVIKNFSQIENMLKVFFASGFAVAMISLFYWFGFLPNGVSYDGRLAGFYASPNYLAMYLAIPLIIAVWFLIKHNLSEGKEKYFWLISVFFILAAIYFTYSYAAWFAIAVSVFLLIYLVAPEEKRKIFFASIFLILIALLLSQSGTSKLENLKNLSYRSSLNSRLMIWRSALAIGQDYPIFGIGPGNFQKYYLDYQKKFSEPYLEWAVPEPHNIFLAFWLEAGIIGLFGFLMILIWFFRRSLNLLKSDSLDRKNFLLVVILFSIMVYTLTHGLFDTTYWKNDLAIIFWLNLGLLIAVKKQPDRG